MLAAVLLAPEGAPQTPPACPCASYGPYPCAAVTLVALADPPDALGLTAAQREAVASFRETHLGEVLEIRGEIQALWEALPDLARPYDPAEVLALFYDLGRHEAALEAALRTAEAGLLALLTEPQRARWAALVAEAARYQEAPGACGPGEER